MVLFNFMFLFRVILILLLSTATAGAANRYIDVNGGTGSQCDGSNPRTLAAATAGGFGTACALNHPNWVFPPTGNAAPFATNRAAAAGDTVVIGQGSYRMGNPVNCTSGNCADATINASCGSGDTLSCISGQIPNGVTVIGCTLTGCGCVNNKGGLVTCSQTRPELWGAGNTNGILNASGSTGVTIKDIEITDHESRGYNYQGANAGTLSCTDTGNSQPTRLSGMIGLLANNATNLNVVNVNSHGICAKGFFGANLAGATFTGFNSEYNAGIGFDNDSTGTCTTCGYTGTTTITNSSISHNGCIEDWQNDGVIVPLGCFGGGVQSGYGDGIGLARTAGDWVITDSDMSYNTSDGADFLYHNRTPYTANGSLIFRRNRFEGNAGNPLKISNSALVEDNFISANCLYFWQQSVTQTSPGPFENCRGAAASIAIDYKNTTDAPIIQNNTVVGNGDTLIISSANAGGTCSGAQTPIVRNNILVGGRDGIQDTSAGFVGGANEYVDLYYNDVGCTFTPTFTSNICVGMFKDFTECTAAGSNQTITVGNQSSAGLVGPLLQGGTTANGSPGTGLSAYATYTTAKSNYSSNFYLTPSSPAVNAANISFGDNLDYNGNNRGASWDIGAIELGSIPPTGCNNNNVLDAGEQCDGTQLNGQSCTTIGLGYTGGTLTCSNCTFVTTQCTSPSPPVCGDGTINGSETCDDGNTANSDCCSSICQTEVSGLENFQITSRWPETDPANHIVTQTHTLSVTGLDRNSATNMRYNGGVGHFTNFTHTFKVDAVSCAAPNGTCNAFVWGASVNPYASITSWTFPSDAVLLGFYQEDNVLNNVYEWYFGSQTYFEASAPPFTRYIRVTRSGTTATAEIFTDVNLTNRLAILTNTPITASALQYLYFPISFNDGFSDASWNFNLSNLNIGESVLSCGGSTPPPSTGGANPNVTMGPGCSMVGRYDIP